MTDEELSKLAKEMDIKIDDAAEAKASKDVQRIGLYLVFAFDRVANPTGGGFQDLVLDTKASHLAVLVANEQFKKPNVSGVQIVNRFSGKVLLNRIK